VLIDCVNAYAQANGDHEVHEGACTFMPGRQQPRVLRRLPKLPGGETVLLAAKRLLYCSLRLSCDVSGGCSESVINIIRSSLCQWPYRRVEEAQ
jgi:hypothetical protein